jgi:hypothetical protein
MTALIKLRFLALALGQRVETNSVATDFADKGKTITT